MDESGVKPDFWLGKHILCDSGYAIFVSNLIFIFLSFLSPLAHERFLGGA